MRQYRAVFSTKINLIRRFIMEKKCSCSNGFIYTSVIENCRKCDAGVYKIPCKYCSGTGKYTLRSKKEVPCNKCEGTGIFRQYPCRECNASGRVFGSRPEKCERCGGKGMVKVIPFNTPRIKEEPLHTTHH